ncbi:MAG: response regulator [Bacteroidota bacterium]|nr:response regulator [Bacteroidota bacterium]
MKKILLIDDEEAMRTTLAYALKLEGFECFTAYDGKNGLELALEQHPDLVLCDIFMPGMNGFETLTAFRSHEQLMPIPFIFLTAHSESNVMRYGMELGADDFLTKPVKSSEVKTAILARLNRMETLYKEGERNIKMMRDHLEELKTLAEVTQKINAGVLLEDICEQVYSAFKSFIPFNRIGLSLIEASEGIVVAHWAKSDSPNVRISKGYHQPLKGSSLEKILTAKQPRIINDLEEYYKDKPGSQSTKDILEEGVRSSLTCPLIAMGKNIGFIFFSSFEKNTYKFEHVEIYTQLAGQIAVVLEKARLYQQLIELNDTKNKFMGIAAHDLRNPLGAIIGFSELLKEEQAIQSSPDLLEYVQNISGAGASALALINDLLDYAAIESGHLALMQETVAIKKLIALAIKTHQMFAKGKNITISAVLDPDIPENIIIDSNRIRQVLDNFLSNAVKYSHEQTHITVHISKQGTNLCCEVTDQGQGIPENELKNLFKEYSRTTVLPTGGEKSTGLGLAIAKKIVKAHGGDVGAKSTVGVGSTFYFTIPIK